MMNWSTCSLGQNWRFEIPQRSTRNFDMLWLWRQAPKRTNSASRLRPVLARRATRDASTANIHGHALVSSRHSRERLNDTPRRPMKRPKAGRRLNAASSTVRPWCVTPVAGRTVTNIAKPPTSLRRSRRPARLPPAPLFQRVAPGFGAVTDQPSQTP
jgi:hypothetical protein